MVGITHVATKDFAWLDFSTIKDMVNSEEKAFLIVGNRRTECRIGVCIAEIVAAKDIVGVACRCVVKVAANDDVVGGR